MGRFFAMGLFLIIGPPGAPSPAERMKDFLAQVSILFGIH
jgi:hypothetical protein